MKTRDKIIQHAQVLFNENGERAITTNHIATHLGISPGNLYYHFNNKEEIIHSIFDKYVCELQCRFQPLILNSIDYLEGKNSNSSLQVLLNYLDSVFVLMWNYRFFYANLSDILSRDKVLKKKYIEVQQELHDNLYSIMSSFRDLDLIVINNDDLNALTKTLHIIALSWINYQAAFSLETKITKQVIYQGMIQMLNIVKPVTTESGRRLFLELETYYKNKK